MYVADLPPQAWIGMVLFVVSGFWSIIANTRLTHELRDKGIHVPFFLQGSTLFLYPFYRPKVSPQKTDRTALVGALALAVLIATVYFLGPYVWPDAVPTR